ncbi:MAG TPA: glycoside hydrolase family protein [Hyphomonadaceae bacterium]|nr:glycoside hydrolase family protein [Hyphomonadaceae bacterium]
MTGRLRTSRAGLELIKSFEGFREQATRLPDGRWTIGYGHVRTAREGLTISPKDAEDLLSYDLKPVEDALYSLIYAPLNQNQFDALVSLVFNISPGQFRESDILRNLNAGDFLNAAAGFDLWRKARIHGRVMVVDALVRRRAAEKAMFLEHPDGRPAAPTPLVTPEIDLASPNSEAQRAPEAAPVGQPRPRRPESDEEPSSGSSNSLVGNEIAEAVRRLAERTQEAVTPTPEIALPPGAEVAGPPPSPPRSSAETRRVVAERIGRILERTEREIKEQQDAEAAAEWPSPQPERVAQPQPKTEAPKTEAPKSETRGPKNEVLEGLPDFDTPAAPAASKSVSVSSNGRRLIDDTETFDPGRDPSSMFAEAQAKAKVVNGRSRRFGPLSGRIVDLLPWIAVLVLSVIGLGIGLVDALKPTADGDANLPRFGYTVLAVFGLMLMMSAYFIFRPASSDDAA